jgi:hypothetical protein
VRPVSRFSQGSARSPFKAARGWASPPKTARPAACNRRCFSSSSLRRAEDDFVPDHMKVTNEQKLRATLRAVRRSSAVGCTRLCARTCSALIACAAARQTRVSAAGGSAVTALIESARCTGASGTSPSRASVVRRAAATKHEQTATHEPDPDDSIHDLEDSKMLDASAWLTAHFLSIQHYRLRLMKNARLATSQTGPHRKSGSTAERQRL